jgi:hypothetical protein
LIEIHLRVVTGLRFKKIGNVFHLQIQQGTLEKYGKIEQNSTNWVKYFGGLII